MNVLPRLDNTTQEPLVLAMLAQHNIRATIHLEAFDLDRDGWKHDQWRVTLSTNTDMMGHPLTDDHGKRRAVHVESFEYRTGTGHRRKPRKTSPSYLDNTPRPQLPEVASVIHCLLSDADAGSESFNDFCDNFGYDRDSIKAFKTYQACMESADKVHRIFSNPQRAELREILEQYC